MKTVFFTSLLSFLFMTAFSQSDKYVGAMKDNISKIDGAIAKNSVTELANNFQRIGDAEKNQWLPYYYAAYLTALQSIMTQDNDQKDPIADKAESLLKSAQEIAGQENSEILVIRSMIATARLTVDPQSRYMTYGPEISEAIKKSEALDPSNPRPVLIEAQNIFYTPESFGGGKEAAKPLFEKAEKLFNTFKPSDELAPVWGKSTLDFFMKNYQ